MSLDKAFLTSKVAQRIFLLFLLCALLPLVILAVVISSAVDSQLSEQAIKRLNQNCKVKGLEIYNNLRALEAELKMFGILRRAARQVSITVPTIIPPARE